MQVAVLGCGNMAKAIVNAVHRKDESIEFLTYTPGQTSAKQLADSVGGKILSELSELPLVDMIIIACKPQQLNALAKELRPYLKEKHHLVSILAATDIQTLQSKLGHLRVTRIMPNTPCGIGEGISLCLHANEVEESYQKNVVRFFNLCSEVLEVEDDSQLDLLTVVAGSGPAYVYEFAAGMEKFLVAQGVDKKLSMKVINKLFVGSSLLMKDSGLDYSVLVDAVTSKAGVTIEAIKNYRDMGLEQITFQSLENALYRSKQISQEMQAK